MCSGKPAHHLTERGFHHRMWLHIVDGDERMTNIPAKPAAAFGSHAALAARLLAALRPDDAPTGISDGSHDLTHILRVWQSAAAIAGTEPSCDVELLAAAVILHDCVAVE